MVTEKLRTNLKASFYLEDKNILPRQKYRVYQDLQFEIVNNQFGAS